MTELEQVTWKSTSCVKEVARLGPKTVLVLEARPYAVRRLVLYTHLYSLSGVGWTVVAEFFKDGGYETNPLLWFQHTPGLDAELQKAKELAYGLAPFLL